MLRPALLASLAVLLAASPTLARTWYVTPDGSGDAPTIQAGIDSAATGDTVLVEIGSYHESLDFGGREILVGSRFVLDGDTAHVAQTVVNASAGRVVAFTSSEGREARLAGLTITGGNASDGGGIRCVGSSPTLDHLRITANAASFGGGGISVQGGSPLVVACSITDNTSEYAGGGIYCMSSAIIIDNNLIEGNYAQDFGGGVSTDSSNPLIMNNRIVGNSSFYAGAGVGSRDCTGVITDNWFADNTGSDYGAGLFY